MNWLAPPIRIIAVALVCIAALIGLVLRETQARAAGTEIVMAMQAIDPRALLSGHYVIISLQEALPAGTPCPPVADGEETWIAFAAPAANTPSRPTGTAATREEAQRLGPLTARGSVMCGEPVTPAEGEGEPQPGWLRTDIGVDRFYVNQTDAERIDKILRERVTGEDSPVSAVLSIGQDGRARLKGLIVAGERMELGWQ